MQSQPEMVAGIRLLNSLHGSGSTVLIPGFDCDSNGTQQSGFPRGAFQVPRFGSQG